MDIDADTTGNDDAINAVFCILETLTVGLKEIARAALIECPYCCSDGKIEDNRERGYEKSILHKSES